MVSKNFLLVTALIIYFFPIIYTFNCYDNNNTNYTNNIQLRITIITTITTITIITRTIIITITTTTIKTTRTPTTLTPTPTRTAT